MNRLSERLFERGFLFSAMTSGSVSLFIFGFMLFMGLPLLSGGLFLSLVAGDWAPARGAYGILPMLAGSLGIALLSLIFAFPMSLGCTCFACVIAPPRVGRLFRRMIQLMTGIPTVIYGFVGIFLLVPAIRALAGGGSGLSLLSAALMLAVLISPTMVLFFSDSLERVPRAYQDAADALGASPAQKLLQVMLPHARKGILGGLILAFGRAMGDTLVALMIAGNAAQVPGSVLDAVRTLTAHIALVIAADYESLEFRSIFACGLVLYMFTAVIVFVLRLAGSSGNRGERI